MAKVTPNISSCPHPKAKKLVCLCRSGFFTFSRTEETGMGKAEMVDYSIFLNYDFLK
jgi:hypothetical protein